MSDKIDFVVTWVDGSDPKWIKTKEKYRESRELQEFKGSEESEGSTESIESKRVFRYRDWDNLHYWFRGIENFTPWVNKVHFITWGHLPSWLNTEHPKINIVKHEDYIPAKYLPTFSSRVIELNMHRIKGLSEQFVYFNDDMFVIKPMDKGDFFYKGLPCDQASLAYISMTFPSDFPHALLNDIGFINRHFNKYKIIRRHFSKWYNMKYSLRKNIDTLLLSWTSTFTGFYDHHLPQSYLKSVFEELWDKEPVLLDETSSRRYRDYRDLNPYVFRYWQLAEGNFFPINMEKRGISVHLPHKYEFIADIIRKQQVPMICGNDGEFENFEKVKEQLNQAFEYILPNKSSFEV